jgi:hypothetical protein
MLGGLWDAEQRDRRERLAVRFSSQPFDLLRHTAGGQATKVGFPMGDDPSRRGASRRRIIGGVEDSLRRLKTDWIDLYQVHRPDPNADIDDTLSALSPTARLPADGSRVATARIRTRPGRPPQLARPLAST